MFHTVRIFHWRTRFGGDCLNRVQQSVGKCASGHFHLAGQPSVRMSVHSILSVDEKNLCLSTSPPIHLPALDSVFCCPFARLQISIHFTLRQCASFGVDHFRLLSIVRDHSRPSARSQQSLLFPCVVFFLPSTLMARIESAQIVSISIYKVVCSAGRSFSTGQSHLAASHCQLKQCSLFYCYECALELIALLVPFLEVWAIVCSRTNVAALGVHSYSPLGGTPGTGTFLS